MKSVEHKSRSDFYHFATVTTSCNNGAARMLAMDGLSDTALLVAHQNASLGSMVATEAIRNLERCVVIEILDNLNDIKGSARAPAIFDACFPWLHPPMMLPVRRQRKLAYYRFQNSHKEVHLSSSMPWKQSSTMSLSSCQSGSRRL